MKLIKKINFMEEKKYVLGLNVAGLLLIFPFSMLFAKLTQLIFRADHYDFSGLDLAYLLVFTFILVVIHEYIHGFFFKFFGKGKAKVKFGFKNGMAYATSPGTFYHRKDFLVIGLAPFVLISLFLTLLAMLGLLSSTLYMPLASLHAAGCVGDFYIALLLLGQTDDILVEDTEVGMNLYQKEERSQG